MFKRKKGKKKQDNASLKLFVFVYRDESIFLIVQRNRKTKINVILHFIYYTFHCIIYKYRSHIIPALKVERTIGN